MQRLLNFEYSILQVLSSNHQARPFRHTFTLIAFPYTAYTMAGSVLQSEITHQDRKWVPHTESLLFIYSYQPQQIRIQSYQKTVTYFSALYECFTIPLAPDLKNIQIMRILPWVASVKCCRGLVLAFHHHVKLQ